MLWFWVFAQLSLYRDLHWAISVLETVFKMGLTKWFTPLVPQKQSSACRKAVLNIPKRALRPPQERKNNNKGLAVNT